MWCAVKKARQRVQKSLTLSEIEAVVGLQALVSPSLDRTRRPGVEQVVLLVECLHRRNVRV